MGGGGEDREEGTWNLAFTGSKINEEKFKLRKNGSIEPNRLIVIKLANLCIIVLFSFPSTKKDSKI